MMAFDFDTSSALLPFFALVATLSVASCVRAAMLRKHTPSRQRIRRASYVSSLFADGPMPDHANVGNTIINVLISFKDLGDCPDEEDVVPIVSGV